MPAYFANIPFIFFMLHQKPDIFCKIELGLPLSKVQDLLAEIDSNYGEIIKYKVDSEGQRKRNKPKYVEKLGEFCTRVINPPTDRLKRIQKRINKYFNNHIVLPDYAFGAVKNRDNVKNARIHKGQKYVFQTDIRDFFPSISHRRVYSALVSVGFSPDVASLITRLTTHKGHLPQGAPTSTFLANLVFSTTGDQIQQIAIQNNLRFTTFVDDVTLSSQSDFKDLVPVIIRIITDAGYKISHYKTTYKSGITEITGVKMLNNSMAVTDKFRVKFSNEMNSDSTKQGMQNYKDRVKEISSKKI